jgi:hypothetical protein
MAHSQLTSLHGVSSDDNFGGLTPIEIEKREVKKMSGVKRNYNDEWDEELICVDEDK